MKLGYSSSFGPIPMRSVINIPTEPVATAEPTKTFGPTAAEQRAAELAQQNALQYETQLAQRQREIEAIYAAQQRAAADLAAAQELQLSARTAAERAAADAAAAAAAANLQTAGTQVGSVELDVSMPAGGQPSLVAVASPQGAAPVPWGLLALLAAAVAGA